MKIRFIPASVFGKGVGPDTSDDESQGSSSSSSTIEVLEDELKLSNITIPKAHPSLNLCSRALGKIAKKMGNAHCVASSLDGSRLAIGSKDGKFILIDLTEAKNNNSNQFQSPQSQSNILQGPKSKVTAIVFSADSTMLFVAWESGELIVFDAKDGRKLKECETPWGLYDCAVSNDNRRVVIAGMHGWKMFEFEKIPSKIKEEAVKSEEKRVSSVDFSNDDTKLVVGSMDGNGGCCVYDSTGTRLLLKLCKGKSVYRSIMSPNNMILAIGCPQKMYLFNIASGDCLHTFQVKGLCKAIEFSNNGQQVFFSTTYGDMVYGYDVYSGNQEFQIKCSDDAVSLAVWKDTLFVACEADGCNVINTAVKPTHQIQHEEGVWDSAVSQSGALIAFAYGSRGVKVYNCSKNILISENSEFAWSVCFSPCGKKIACNGYGKINVYNAEDGTKERTIETPYFDWMKFLEDGEHILIFKKEEKTADVIKIDNDDDTSGIEFSIATSKKILSASFIPRKHMFAIATEEEVNFYNAADGSMYNKLTYSLNERDGKLQKMKFSSNGSRMILCFRTHLSVFKFHSARGVDSSSQKSSALPLQDDKEAVIRNMTISNDDKIVAICDSKDCIHTFCLEEGEGREVHTCPMHFTVGSLDFLPRSSSEGHYPLVLSYGEKRYEAKYTTTLEINAKECLVDPSLLRCFAVCDDETMLSLISEHKHLLFKRDENGMTLAELAVEQERPAILHKIVDVDPSLAWTSLKVLVYFLLTSRENIIEIITIGYKCAFPHTDPAILEELVKMIPTLAENGFTEIICYILQAGSSRCVSGFVPCKSTYLQAFLNYPLFRISSSLVLNENKPCNGRQIISETSPSPSGIEVYDEQKIDEKKRILLNLCRVLLPYLSSYAVINALVDMIDLSSGEESEGSNVIPQHLKPFQYQSLQASIDAAWYKWAGPMFLRRALLYILWMLCIICLEYTTNFLELKVAFIIAVCVGWMYFVRIEAHQMQNKESSFIRYLLNFWNLWQVLSLVLVLIYVCINIIDMTISSSSRMTILFEQKWFTGLVHLFTLINVLYYCRGIERASWILYALGVLIIKMSYFLVILLWILVSACGLLTKVNGAFDSQQPIHVFTETYVTAIFGAFESSEFCSDPYIEASRVVLILFIFLSSMFMIFTNAMIAFISEAFADILDYKAAILAREKACLIADLYNSLSAEQRRIIEEQCKWAYKLFKQTALKKMESGHSETDADGRRATKQDLHSAVAKLRKENGEIKSSLEELRKENGETRKENGEMKIVLERMLSVLSETK